MTRPPDKLDWLLACERHRRRSTGDAGLVPVVRDVGEVAFRKAFWLASRPALIEGVADDWPALRKWSLPYFADTLGDAPVSWQDRRSTAPGGSYERRSEEHRVAGPFSVFVAPLLAGVTGNDRYMTANNTAASGDALASLWPDVGPLPPWLDPLRPGRYFWLGPGGTITPWHHDLTSNLLVVVFGRKVIQLVPWWDTPFMDNAEHCFSGHGERRLEPCLHPGPAEPVSQVVEMELGPGAGLFVPVGWWHRVEAMDACCMISFTNFVWPNDYHALPGAFAGVRP